MDIFYYFDVYQDAFCPKSISDKTSSIKPKHLISSRFHSAHIVHGKRLFINFTYLHSGAYYVQEDVVSTKTKVFFSFKSLYYSVMFSDN